MGVADGVKRSLSKVTAQRFLDRIAEHYVEFDDLPVQIAGLGRAVQDAAQLRPFRVGDPRFEQGVDQFAQPLFVHGNSPGEKYSRVHFRRNARARAKATLTEGVVQPTRCAISGGVSGWSAYRKLIICRARGDRRFRH